MGAVTHSNLDDVFTYHKPKGDFQVEKYHGLRQAAKECAKVQLDHLDAPTRLEAIEKFERYLRQHTGDCRDQQEAIGLLHAARAFVGGAAAALAGKGQGPEHEAETTQAVVASIRCALMWANASVALEARI